MRFGLFMLAASTATAMHLKMRSASDASSDALVGRQDTSGTMKFHTGRATLHQAGLSVCGDESDPDSYAIIVPSKYNGTIGGSVCDQSVTIDFNNMALTSGVYNFCDDCGDDDLYVSRRVFDYFGITDPNVDYIDCLWYAYF